MGLACSDTAKRNLCLGDFPRKKDGYEKNKKRVKQDKLLQLYAYGVVILTGNETDSRNFPGCAFRSAHPRPRASLSLFFSPQPGIKRVR